MPVGELDDVFGGVEAEVPDALADHLRGVALIDHHVHGVFTAPLDRADFEASINEGSTDPVPAFMSQFDSPLGLSIRRWCAPLLGLDAAGRAPTTTGRAAASSTPDELARADAARRGRVALDRRHRASRVTSSPRPSGSPSSAASRRRRSCASNGSPRTCWRTARRPTTFPTRSGRHCGLRRTRRTSLARRRSRPTARVSTSTGRDRAMPTSSRKPANWPAGPVRCGSTARC